MAFRANDAVNEGFESAKKYLIPIRLEEKERVRSERRLIQIYKEYGPVVKSYPSWHPIVTHHDERHPATIPGTSCGYHGLDHTEYFANAFITCPYGDGKEVIASVEKLAAKYDSVATLSVELLDVQFYSESATPILVTCDWEKGLEANGLIPASLAVPLMLEKEIPGWKWAQRGETWETMRPYFLGEPHGSRSSLFVSSETAMLMKKIWNLIISTEMFGPVKSR